MARRPYYIELYRTLPIIVLAATLGLVLFLAIVLKGEASRRFSRWAIGAGLTAAIAAAVGLYPATGIGTGTDLIGRSIVFDPLFLFMTVFLSVYFLGILILSPALWPKDLWEWPVFWALLLGSLIGMILLASTRHLIFFAVAFELASLPSYVLVGFRRRNAKAAEGAAKYAVFGAVCSAVMVYGISLLYGLTGSFDVQIIAGHLAGGPLQAAATVALLCLLVGIGFKISLVPMHFWSPDAFEAAGADICAWLSVASKSAALVALARFVHLLASPAGDAFHHNLVVALATLSIATMTVGNLSAYWQTSVKRLLAYSSIAHAGYITCAVAALAGAEGGAAVVAYLLVYLLMNLGAFAVTGLVEQQTGSDHLSHFAGLSTQSPKLAALMMFFLFSLVGLPPLAGFAVKWILLAVLWQHQLPVLVVAVLANTLLSLFFYMRIARAMYFEDTRTPPIIAPRSVDWLLTACACALLVLFLGWGYLNSFARGLFAVAFQ